MMGIESLENSTPLSIWNNLPLKEMSLYEALNVDAARINRLLLSCCYFSIARSLPTASVPGLVHQPSW